MLPNSSQFFEQLSIDPLFEEREDFALFVGKMAPGVLEGLLEQPLGVGQFLANLGLGEAAINLLVLLVEAARPRLVPRDLVECEQDQILLGLTVEIEQGFDLAGQAMHFGQLPHPGQQAFNTSKGGAESPVLSHPSENDVHTNAYYACDCWL